MGSDREKVLKRRSREAKALQKKQYRQQVIRNKKKDGRKRFDDVPGIREDEDESSRIGTEYDGLGFAGSWSGSGGVPGTSGEEPEEG